MILNNKIISTYYSGEKDFLVKKNIIVLPHTEKPVLRMKYPPCYGLMNNLCAAYVSVESIINIIKHLPEILE